MSGHSKWATTKRRKFAVDAKRSAAFTKLANNITIAARSGSDPIMNFKLRMAIDKARSFNVPRENIDRAIKKGAGELEGAQIKEEIYEGFGPSGIALIIEAITDNTNRTVSAIKHTLQDHGGSLGGPNSVMWQFERKGVVRLTINDKLQTTDDKEKLELKLIDLGVDDLIIDDEGITVYTKIENLQKIKETLEKDNLTVESAQLEFVPKETVKITDSEIVKKVEALFEALDDLDDVSEHYTNADI